MQVKVGIDIIEVERIKQSIEEIGEGFIDRVYTDNEIKYCESKKNNKYQHYAARFAVKEAAFKAISTLLNDKYSISWKNVETIDDEKGKPSIKFVALSREVEKELSKIISIDVSISHIKEYAVANVSVLIWLSYKVTRMPID